MNDQISDLKEKVNYLIKRSFLYSIWFPDAKRILDESKEKLKSLTEGTIVDVSNYEKDIETLDELSKYDPDISLRTVGVQNELQQGVRGTIQIKIVNSGSCPIYIEGIRFPKEFLFNNTIKEKVDFNSEKIINAFLLPKISGLMNVPLSLQYRLPWASQLEIREKKFDVKIKINENFKLKKAAVGNVTELSEILKQNELLISKESLDISTNIIENVNDLIKNNNFIDAIDLAQQQKASILMELKNLISETKNKLNVLIERSSVLSSWFPEAKRILDESKEKLNSLNENTIIDISNFEKDLEALDELSRYDPDISLRTVGVQNELLQGVRGTIQIKVVNSGSCPIYIEGIRFPKEISLDDFEIEKVGSKSEKIINFRVIPHSSGIINAPVTLEYKLPWVAAQNIKTTTGEIEIKVKDIILHKDFIASIAELSEILKQRGHLISKESLEISTKIIENANGLIETYNFIEAIELAQKQKASILMELKNRMDLIAESKKKLNVLIERSSVLSSWFPEAKRILDESKEKLNSLNEDIIVNVSNHEKDIETLDIVSKNKEDRISETKNKLNVLIERSSVLSSWFPEAKHILNSSVEKINSLNGNEPLNVDIIEKDVKTIDALIKYDPEITISLIDGNNELQEGMSGTIWVRIGNNGLCPVSINRIRFPKEFSINNFEKVTINSNSEETVDLSILPHIAGMINVPVLLEYELPWDTDSTKIIKNDMVINVRCLKSPDPPPQIASQINTPQQLMVPSTYVPNLCSSQPVEVRIGGLLTFFLYLFSFLVFPIGLLFGVLWLGFCSDPEKQRIGKNCLIAGILGVIIPIILVILFIFGMIAISSILSMIAISS